MRYHEGMEPAKRPPNDRGQGRKPKSLTGEVMKNHPVRWTDSEWADAKYIGLDRVRELVRKDAAKKRRAAKEKAG